jgi:hypothetical protein
MAGSSNGKKMTKMEGVRRTLVSLGPGATPTAIREHLKREYKIEMTNEHISNYKNTILREQKAAAKPAPAPTAAVPAAPAEAPRPAVAGLTLEDVRAAKELVARVGAEQLKALIDVLGR